MLSSGHSPCDPEKQNINGSGGGLPGVYGDQTRQVSNSEYKQKQSILNGACQIVLGSICIVFNSISLGLEPKGYGIVSQGFWGGAIYVITGILGIFAGKKHTRRLILVFFVFCLLTAFINSPGATVASTFGAIRYDNEGGFEYITEYKSWRLASQIVLLVLSVTQFGFAIWGCVISGMAVVWQGTSKYDIYRILQSKISGIAQIVIGILLIAFNATLIGLKPHGLAPVCHGFLGGWVFIFTGAFGVVAGRTRARGPVMTYQISSGISIGLAVAVCILAAILLAMRHDDCNGLNADLYCNGHPDAIIAMHSVMLALALLEIGFAIWGCVLGSKVICRCC